LQPRESVREPPVLTLADLLIEKIGLVGPGRVEIEVDAQGRVGSVWKHERQGRAQLARQEEP
jgi:hypothetical protein